MFASSSPSTEEAGTQPLDAPPENARHNVNGVNLGVHGLFLAVIV
jgi:hypothetical protein